VGLALAANPDALQCVGPAPADCQTRHADDGTGPLPFMGVSIGCGLR
jgi:hypothetical protein